VCVCILYACVIIVRLKFLWHLYVCVSVCLLDNNFRKPSRKKFIFVHPVYLQGIQVKFIYEGRWVKVKVTGANNITNACLCIDQLPSAIFINTRQMAPQTMHHVWSCLRLEACLFTVSCIVTFDFVVPYKYSYLLTYLCIFYLLTSNPISELTVLMYRCSDVCNQ